MKDVYAKLRDEHIDTLKRMQMSQKELDELKINMQQLLASQQVKFFILIAGGIFHFK